MFIEHKTLYDIGIDLLEKAAKQGQLSAEMILRLKRQKSHIDFSG